MAKINWSREKGKQKSPYQRTPVVFHKNDTMGDLINVASSPSDVLSQCSTSDEETDTPNTSNQDEAEASGDSHEEMGGESSSSSSGTKRKKKVTSTSSQAVHQ